MSDFPGPVCMEECGKLPDSKLSGPLTPISSMGIGQTDGNTAMHRVSPQLFDEECNTVITAVLPEFLDPLQMEWAGRFGTAGFPADDHPVDAFEV